MNEFMECIGKIEMEDILSCGFHLPGQRVGSLMEFFWISDHSPALLKLPNEAWKVDIEGHMMYKIVKKMKLMKQVLKEYYDAIRDENNLLMQKAKIEWLKDGDRNTEFFHKIIKGRMHKGRIMTICNEKRERFENEKVAEQFVKHF
ncbi:hypothetical protein Tco_0277065 [Tanacetum coccineum]